MDAQTQTGQPSKGKNRIRHRIDPGDVPPALAARRLGLTETQFLAMLPELSIRGFPPPDPTTGMFDLDAIDAWRRARNPHLFLTHNPPSRDARIVVPSRLEEQRWAK